jgi:hypothetical protein
LGANPLVNHLLDAIKTAACVSNSDKAVYEEIAGNAFSGFLTLK